MILLLVTLISISASAEVELSNATQSSTLYSATADRAIDGVISTDSTTKKETSPWIRVYFNKYSKVESVVIKKGYSYNSTCTYTVSVYNKEESSVCGTYNKINIVEYGNEIVQCGGRPGHSVMLQMSGCTYYLVINEMAVYGESFGIATTPDNLEIGDGINGSLSCVVYTPHESFTSIGWFTSDGTEITKNVTTLLDTPSSGQATITLAFTPVTISDMAEYYCQIVYDDSTIGTVTSTTVKLDVYEKNFINSLPLTLTSEKFSSGIINVEKDDDVTLTCAVQGPLKKSVSLIVRDDEDTIIPQDPTPEVIIITDKVGEVTWTRKASCGDSIYKCRVNTTQYIKYAYLFVIVGSCGSASATVIIGGAVILIAAIIIIMLLVVLLLRKKSVVT